MTLRVTLDQPGEPAAQAGVPDEEMPRPSGRGPGGRSPATWRGSWTAQLDRCSINKSGKMIRPWFRQAAVPWKTTATQTRASGENRVSTKPGVLQTVERRGMRTFVVLRQYPGGLGLQGSLEKEIANLGVVAGSGLPVPSILATDVAGASTGGAPSLLMTRLQGHVHLNPAEPRSWMTRIAEIAVLLHSLDLPAKMFRPWTDSWIAPLDGFQVPVDAQKPAVWKAAFGVMAAPPPKDTAVFLHCDLLPVNMLWSRGRITGLTDWNSIHRGARAIDVGHCRRYLAALYSPEWSEQLRSLYESIAGVTLDPWWDLYALLHYDDSGPKWIRSQVAGRRPVDVPGMTSRVEVAIETALRRLG